MEFKNEFKYPDNIKNRQQKENFENMAYNTFCVNFVNSVLKDKLNFNTEKEDEKIIYSIGIPVLKNVQNLNQISKKLDLKLKQKTKPQIHPSKEIKKESE